MSESASGSAQGSAAAIGRSGIFLGLAKLWFLATAYGIAIGLAHLLPPAAYGRYYVVARIVTVPNLVLVYSLMFAVSRPLAAEWGESFPRYHTLRARGFRLAVVMGGGATLAVAAAAPVLGSILDDAELVFPLLIAAPISAIYATYAVNVGTINALRRFRMQAALDVFMATSKAAFMLVAAALGGGLVATVGGFTAASLAVLVLSSLLVSRVHPRGGEGGRAALSPGMGAFAGSLVLFTACVNLLQSVDVVLVKGFASPDDVGFYSSAQQVALVPLSLMNAVSLLMFPLVAALGSHPERVRSYVAGTVKVSLVLLAFMASVGAAAAPEVQALLFPRAYGAAAGDLRLLVWGMSGYSLAITIAWILNSTQRPRVALLVVATPLVVVVAVALGLLPGFGTRGAAIAVACGGAVATVLALGAVTRLFAARPRVADLLRLVAAVAAVEVVAAGWSSPPAAGAVGRLGILARLAALAATYLVVAFGTRLVRVAELRSLRRGA